MVKFLLGMDVACIYIYIYIIINLLLLNSTLYKLQLNEYINIRG